MGSQLEKHAGSVRFWIFVVVCAYFAYAVYFAIYGLNFSISLIYDRYVYGLVSQNPWWWAVLYYGSEGISGSISIMLRAIGGAFAAYAAYFFWRRKDTTLPLVRSGVSKALLLEACAFLALIPSVIAAFTYYSSTEYLYYFDHTPGQLLLFGTGIPCLAMVLVIPPVLLKLRATISRSSPNKETIRWTCIAGVAYLFVVFWFNYSMLWAATMVAYPRSQQEYGMSFLLQPANLASFAVTVFGLLLTATLALAATLPAIRRRSTELNLDYIGTVALAFGSYFIFNTAVYYLTGGYGGHPSVWYEVIGPLHNPYLWCASFAFLGLAILIYSRAKKKVPA
jgi:magnesium-transporting ATPase (P-type)